MILSGRKAALLVGALILSVCINMLAAGLILGKGWGTPRSKRGGEHAVERLLETLPEQTRAAARSRFEAHRPELRDRLSAVREARKNVAALLGRPEVSREQLDAALAELRSRSADAQQVVHQAMVEAAADMPPEARRQWQPRWWSIR